MGQRSGLSAGDIAAVEMMYPKPPAQDPIGTIKGVAKDPLTDPPTTFKEIRKDPIQDTRKELVADPTIKEGGFDPGPFVDPGLQPFVLGTGHQAPGFADAGGVQQGLMERAQALAAMDQDRAVLMQEYDQIMAMLSGGTGTV
jgi:hypothetical protein